MTKYAQTVPLFARGMLLFLLTAHPPGALDGIMPSYFATGSVAQQIRIKPHKKYSQHSFPQRSVGYTLSVNTEVGDR